MMQKHVPLVDLRIVEVSAFVAAPFAGLTLAQLGADVVRVDPMGGGLDYHRRPVTKTGKSLYWLGLNRMKRSFAADVKHETIREIVRRMIIEGGPSGGILLTNVSPSWLRYDRLAASRSDVIVVEIQGSHDGSIAVDYTVNAAVGFPGITGDGTEPVNHVLPAWDLLAGKEAAVAIIAAAARRSATGEGAHIKVPLADVAISATASLGFIAEVEANDDDRRADGNFLFGSYGKDFLTVDGRRVMVVALTPRHWASLIGATGSSTLMAEIEAVHDLDLTDEGDRFTARHEISEAIKPWFATRTFDDVAQALDANRACWGPYQSIRQSLETDPRFSPSNPLIDLVEQPEVGVLRAPRSPIGFEGRPAATAAHELGADTRAILGELGLDAAAVADLAGRGLI